VFDRQSKQGEKLAWLEGVSRGGVGAVLGIGIGAVCLALPAFADFLVRTFYTLACVVP
jgi:hypothetical protein